MGVFRKPQRTRAASESERHNQLAQASLRVYFVHPGEACVDDPVYGIKACEPDRTRALARLIHADQANRSRPLAVMIDRSYGLERRVMTARVLTRALGVAAGMFTLVDALELEVFSPTRPASSPGSARFAELALSESDIVVITAAPIIARISRQSDLGITAVSATRIDYGFEPTSARLTSGGACKTLRVP